MDKFGRNYNLLVQDSQGNTVQITPPLTLEFDVTRNLLGSANSGSFRIFNLSKQNRNNLRFNNYNFAQFRFVKLYAGYGNNLALVFSGNVQECWSVREGVNFITEIQCFDSGFAYAVSDSSFSPTANTNQIDIAKQIISDMQKVDPNVSLGSISTAYSGQITRGNAIKGGSTDQMIENFGNGFFIDNGAVNLLQDDECLPGQVSEVSASSGLLGTPLLQQNILHFDMVFQPNLRIGQLINLVSTTDDFFTGSYKISAVTHHGMISDAVCGDLVTSVDCITGRGALSLVDPI